MRELVDAVTGEEIPLETALKVLTSNVATVLKLKSKGRLEVGKDADVLVFDENYKIEHLIAMGDFLTKNSKILKKGSYEA